MGTTPLTDIVNVVVQVSPTAAIPSGFNLGLIIGQTAVISGSDSDRVRLYTDVTQMITDGFASNSPEYLAAQLYFGQSPRPASLAVGRWIGTESALSAVQACRLANTNWYGFTVCGVTAVDIFAIAAYVESAQPASVYFYTTNDADSLTGTTATAGILASAASPVTDISALTTSTFKIAVDQDAYPTIPNYQTVTLSPAGNTTGAKTALEMQSKIRALGGLYSQVSVVYTTVYTITSGSVGSGSKVLCAVGDSNDIAASLKINTGTVLTTGTGSLGLAMKGLSYTHTLGQFSTVSVDAAAAILGYAMGANTGLMNSAYTLAYKSEVGVTVEPLTVTQLSLLKFANLNVYVSRGNVFSLFEQGVMASGMHFDTRLGLDQLSTQIQIAVMNLLISVSKVPQSEGGITMLYNAIDKPLSGSFNTGFLCRGVWTGPTIKTLVSGNTLDRGYLILSDLLADQTDADRVARRSPPIYIPVKLAGAIESVVFNVLVNQ